MTEYPVFVPFEDAFLAAVITVPDKEATGLVLLLTGTGAPRSHRYQLWTRAARRLAEKGLASVRLEYRGIGDSTGRVQSPILGDGRLEQSIELARFTLRALGLKRLVVAGNCSGAIVALGVAARVPQCEGAVCILPRVVQVGKLNQMALGARKSRLGGWMRSRPMLRRLVRGTMVRGGKDEFSQPVEEAFEPALAHARLLFLYSELDREPYVDKSRRLLEHATARLPERLRRNFELRMTRTGPLTGFDGLHIQDEVLDTVEAWVVDRFAHVVPERPPLQGLGAGPQQS